jgi:hypothetical protein
MTRVLCQALLFLLDLRITIVLGGNALKSDGLVISTSGTWPTNKCPSIEDPGGDVKLSYAEERNCLFIISRSNIVVNFDMMCHSASALMNC